MEKAEGQVVRYECIVHKANVPLATGESLNKYTNALSAAGGAYVKKQLNLNSLAKPAYAGTYMLEAYADKCVFDVYKYSGTDAPGEYKYYALSYTRKANGDFEFKDLTEVERVVSFQAKPSMSIAKAKSKKDMEEELEEAEEEAEEEGEEEAELAKKPTKKQFAPGWNVKKAVNIWDGLI